MLLGSLKSSSRRRPVSVDYDLSSEKEINTTNPGHDQFQMSGISDGGGGALQDTTNNRSSNYSNRNSHPLTEREVEQGLQSLEGQKGENKVHRWIIYLGIGELRNANPQIV